MKSVVVITGAGGFVGRRLIPRLLQILPPQVSLVALSRNGGASADRLHWREVDVTARDAVRQVILDAEPCSVIHLAASARSNYRADEIGGVWKVNLDGTLNVAQAILDISPSAWLLNVSSGMVFGANAGDGAVSEDISPAPQNPYSASKYAAEVALRQLAREGLRFVTARPFNHSGPGQSADFFVPALIRRVLRHKVQAPRSPFSLRSADHVRDFLHVEDVVTAYARLLDVRDQLAPGAVLNVCSGEPVSLREIASFALTRAGLKCDVQAEDAETRDDLRSLVGDNSRMEALGWAPSRGWREIVDDTYAWMEREFAA
jgi:GDP-4-dehydro-6-deoxy-D-mannose reductase